MVRKTLSKLGPIDQIILVTVFSSPLHLFMGSQDVNMDMRRLLVAFSDGFKGVDCVRGGGDALSSIWHHFVMK